MLYAPAWSCYGVLRFLLSWTGEVQEALEKQRHCMELYRPIKGRLINVMPETPAAPDLEQSIKKLGYEQSSPMVVAKSGTRTSAAGLGPMIQAKVLSQKL